jgi:hypothetical protein
MKRLLTLILLPVLAWSGQVPETKPDHPAAKARRDRLLGLYRGEAAGYVIYRDRSRKEKVELRREPVYSWTNPIRGGEQDGDVFVWTCRGRAEAVGTFFSYPSTGPRNLNHEFHSLSTSVLDVDRPGGANQWTPQAPGVDLVKIQDGPEPARSPTLRLSQMRELTRAFSASTEDLEGKRWELRLLPQPLYRYESTDPDVLDGAVFAFVTSAGTDPEAILLIEARKPAGSPAAAPIWHSGVARFSDLKLVVRHKGKEIYKGEPIPWDAPEQDPKQRYRTFRDRGIAPIEETSPR